MSVDDIKQKFVCSDCIGDHALEQRIVDECDDGLCGYCNGQGEPCIKIDDLAGIVDEVYREHHVPGDEYVYFEGGSDKPSFDTRGDSPSEIVQRMIEPAEYAIAEDIVSVNSHDEGYAVIHDGEAAYYEEAFNYVETPVYDHYHTELWSNFCETVKHRSRFFNSDARALLDEILEDVGELKTVGDALPIREFGGPGSEELIYRGRRADSRAAVSKLCMSPATELGPPPRARSSAGRMNPAGIPVLYGSLDRTTCIAELRAPIGSTVVTGTFEVVEPIRILDLIALKGAYRLLSFFQDDFEQSASHLKFLRKLDSEISKPIMPSDEILEYIPTQAFIEYLAALRDPPFDGLIFSSAQSGAEGRNIVIFPHATRVQIPENFTEEAIYAESFSQDEEGELSLFLFEGDETDLADGGHLEYTKQRIAPSEAFSDDPVVRFVDDSVRIHRVRGIEHIVETTDPRIVAKSELDDHKF